MSLGGDGSRCLTIRGVGVDVLADGFGGVGLKRRLRGLLWVSWVVDGYLVGVGCSVVDPGAGCLIPVPGGGLGLLRRESVGRGLWSRRGLCCPVHLRPEGVRSGRILGSPLLYLRRRRCRMRGRCATRERPVSAA